MQLKWVFLLGVSLASRAACGRSTFVNPPPWDPEDDGIRDFSNNRRYRDGDFVKVRIFSKPAHVTMADLHVWQVNPADEEKGEHKLVEDQFYKGIHFWKAEYDMARYLKHGEDAVYWFGLLVDGQTKPNINSTYFNVSMPESWKPYLPAASGTTSLVQESPTSQPPRKSTTQPRPDSTATKKPSRQGKKSGTRSGLTGPQVAGIVIGAVVAFILMVAGFCWGFERMRVARQLQRSHEFELRNMERDVRALRETVSKLGS